MNYQAKISNEQLNELPFADFAGEIVVIDDKSQDLDTAVAYLKAQDVIGFDTETKPNFQPGNHRNKVALLQLSGPDKAFLFRICRRGLDRKVASILASRRIVKVGVAVRDDIRLLREMTEFRPGTFVDLQNIVGSYGIEEKSVKKMAAIILGTRVSKTQQLSNWEAPVLSAAQEKYAAIDAWICREMYLALNPADKQ